MIIASSQIRRRLAAALVLAAAATVTARVLAQPPVAQPQIDVDARLKGFDDYMAQVLKDWNAPGIGVGIVVKDKLVFAKGYGFRDYGNKLPYTPTTTQPIASNSKLFTAVASGLLVEEGKLRWDEPIKRFVPGIRFYNDELDRSVTIRDMLSHRTGVTRHDSIWYKSTFTRRELWDRLRYLEPAAPIRTTFLYNNLMYTAAGQVIEELSGLTWEQFVKRRIFDPLGMSRSTLTIEDNIKGPEPAVPFSERRDSSELYRQPYYTAEVAIAPAGAINSNVQDLSRWVIALLNNGSVDGKQVIPSAAIRETMSPSLAMPNAALESRGWGENLNQYLRHGPLDFLVPGSPAGAPRRRPSWISLTGLDHAQRFHRRDRARHRRSRGALLQRAHVRHLRAPARDVAHALVRAAQRHPAQEQGSRDQGSFSGQRWTGERHDAVASARRLRGRIRACRVRRRHRGASRRRTGIRVPWHQDAAQPLPLRPLRYARRRTGRQVLAQLPDESDGRSRERGYLAGRSRGDVHTPRSPGVDDRRDAEDVRGNAIRPRLAQKSKWRSSPERACQFEAPAVPNSNRGGPISSASKNSPTSSSPSRSRTEKCSRCGSGIRAGNSPFLVSSKGSAVVGDVS